MRVCVCVFRPSLVASFMLLSLIMLTLHDVPSSTIDDIYFCNYLMLLKILFVLCFISCD